MPTFACRKSNPNLPSGCKDFNVNRDKILRQVVWLKENNCNYQDIIIDFDALHNLPIDGSACHDLQSYSLDDESEEDGSLEVGPNQSNATIFIAKTLHVNANTLQNLAMHAKKQRKKYAIMQTCKRMQIALGTAYEGAPFCHY